MATILVTGATGLLGSSLLPVLRARGHRAVAHGHTGPADVNADLTSAAQCARMLEQVNPDVVINLAALTNVDGCERDPQQAYLLNVRTVENLARHTGPGRAHLVHISTDQVYDGAGPFREDDVTVCNTYAFSKIASELAAGACATVLRTNFFGRSQCARRSSFSDWLYQSLRAQTPIQVFEDVLFSPLAIDTLCTMLAACAERKPAGVYNLGARDGMSKADFAYAFAAAIDAPADNMQRARARDAAQLAARRPSDMRMDCTRFEQALGLTLPSLIDEINRCASQYHE